jgi:hypothetical protein
VLVAGLRTKIWRERSRSDLWRISVRRNNSAKRRFWSHTELKELQIGARILSPRYLPWDPEEGSLDHFAVNNNH